MSERLGSVAYERDGGSFSQGLGLPLPGWAHDYRDETTGVIDPELRGIVEGALERTISILRRPRETLEHTARRLLEKETLDEAELLRVARSCSDAGPVPVRAAPAVHAPGREPMPRLYEADARTAEGGRTA